MLSAMTRIHWRTTMISRYLVLAVGLSLTACTAPPNSTAPVSFNSNDVAGVGVARFTRSGSGSTASPTNDRDCDSFPNSAAAQQFFINAGGPQSDPHDLDRDGDGYACEWGTDLRRRAAAEEATRRRAAAAAARPRPVRTASRCYTGPRGGTYTITASGNRNYSGC